ncbi:syndecan-1-like [Arapaima gigas]
MKSGSAVVGLLCLAWCLPATLSRKHSSLPEDVEWSSSDMEYSGSGDWMDKEIIDDADPMPPRSDNFDSSGDGRNIPVSKEKSGNSMSDVLVKEEYKIIPHFWSNDQWRKISDGSDLTWMETQDFAKRDLLERTEDLIAVVAAGLAALTVAAALVSFMVCKLKKKDEGSYDIGKPIEKYQKPQEFFF